jgi:hypothetical protein
MCSRRTAVGQFEQGSAILSLASSPHQPHNGEDGSEAPFFNQD